MQLSKRKQLITLRMRRPLIHMVVIVLSFIWIWKVRLVTDLIPFVQLRIPFIDLNELYLFAWISALIFIIIWMAVGLYELSKPIHSYYRKFLKVIWIWFMVSSFLAYMWFWFVFVNWISRFVVIVGAIVAFFILTILDIFYNKINNIFERKNPYNILILWDSSLISSEIVNKIHDSTIYNLTIIGIDEYERVLLLEYDVVLAAWTYDNDLLQNIADDTRIVWLSFYHINETFFLEDIQAIPSRLWPLFAMEYCPSPLDWWWRIIKRIFDVIVSLCAIILLSPLLLIIALIIIIDTKWPALYKQPRVWKNAKQFTFIKFRTMYTHLSVWEQYWWKKAWAFKEELMQSESNVRKWELQKIENDPRVTRVWKFLRRTSLDELPNLFSVFLWNMSLVWPRPHEPFEVARYKPWQKRLLSVKPWITWYAQLFGRDSLSFSEEAKLDLYYIQNRSLILDIYVLISTVKVVLKWN